MKIKGIYRMADSQYYWFRWTQDGIRNAVSLKTSDLGEAIQKAQSIRDGAAVMWQQKQEQPITQLTKLVDDYLNKAQARSKKALRPRTANRRNRTLLQFIRQAKITSVADITTRAIEGWLAGFGAETACTYGRSIHTFCKYLVEKRLLSSEVLKFDLPCRPSNGRKSWLAMDKANKVIAAATDPNLKCILFCGFHAGLRKSEITNLKVGWFDLGQGLLHVQNDPDGGFVLKDRDNRVVPLTPAFQAFLATYLQGRAADQYVLAPEKSNGERREYRYDWKRIFYSHMRACGVKCTPHDMRRSFASNLVSKGISIYKVARWLGDGVVVVEKSYGHLAPADRDVDVLSF